MTRTIRSVLAASLALSIAACSAGAPDPESDEATSSAASTSAVSGSGGSSITVGGGGSPIDLDAGQQGGAASDCPLLPSDTEAEVTLGAAFAPYYSWHDLGPVPGVPGRLGGCVLEAGNPDALLIAGDSEASTGAIYRIDVVRDACKHIVGFSGTATQVATAPNVDANLLYGANSVLIYPQWPVNEISQHPSGSSTAAATMDMATIGVESSVSGLGFVPSYLPASGGTRTLTWPIGNWYHLDLAFNGTVYSISNPSLAATLEGGPGGFAYVPPGSPGFSAPSIIVAEWSAHKVAVYQASDQGDPIVATRQEFFPAFPAPWGAYFDPGSGDYLFLTWGSAIDRVYVVHGLTKPPPPEVPK
jgi:hypothetical protein